MKKYLLFLSMLAIVIGIAAQIQTGPSGIQVSSLAKQQKVVLDLSHHTGVVDFETMANLDIKWVYLKATEGTSWTDEAFLSNYNNAKAAGLKVGAYHFMSVKSSAQAQANHFLETIRDLDLDLIPVIDIECIGDYTPQQLVDSAKVILDAVESLYSCKPMIYASENYFNRYLGKDFENYPRWVAKYSSQAPEIGVDYTMWQVSEKGILPGLDSYVDVSVFANEHRPRDIKLPSKQKDKKKSKKH